ncbi:MAG: 30S ribosomal protein S21 [Flavobacteriales bacterium]|nr:30S ribosomal protein S21 [Flavobacteriales bacterium]MCX7650866.1 30S ribosomal protein S21 [Flavobacteriales bacterium]MDW8432932.1 30S ribosomal protein S21 [Flavobacteriales bacterium]
MLIIPIREGENIDKALKKYKRKFEKTGVVKKLREKQQYTKKSVLRRNEILRAAFRERYIQNHF